MRRQAADFEAVEAAAVSVQSFSAVGFPQGNVSFDIVNTGPTQANDIQLAFGERGIPPKRLLGPGRKETGGIGPSAVGFSLAPGQRQHFSGTGVFLRPLKGISPPRGAPTADDVIRGKLDFYITLTLAYRDVFGRSHISEECLRYEGVSRKFTPCVFGGSFMR